MPKRAPKRAPKKESKKVAKQDFEALTVILSVAMIIAIASFVSNLMVIMPVGSNKISIGAQSSDQERQINMRFQQAIGLLHAKQYNYAITALDSVLEIAPGMPEAYVNMGYAFIGLQEFGPARGAFEKAIDLKVDQVNAYYGLAIVLEGQGQYEAALGSMRTYIHLSDPNDPYLAKARSALWEWEAQLGRVKGVKPAPEGEKGATIKAPGWDSGH